MSSFKIATWNVNSLRVRLPHVQEWLRYAQPDVLALQEIKLPDTDFPMDIITGCGYSAIVSGQKTYNGVAILTRSSVTDIITDIPELDDPQRRILCATIGDICVLNIYVPNGQSVGSEKYQYKLNWLSKLDLFLKQQLQKHKKMIVLGDFNIAPEEIDVHDPTLWQNSVLFSDPERQAFRDMLKLGFKDCFRLHHPTDKLYSWWDYRLNAFKRNMGLRIDHILASDALAATSELCMIDKTPREWDRPSDHAPVVAQFHL